MLLKIPPDNKILSPEQKVAFCSEKRFQDYNGGIRSGKTEIAIFKALKEAFKQPGIKILITRDTGPALYTTTRDHVLSLLDPKLIADSWQKPTMRYLLVNGSELHFIAYEDIDQTKAGGTEYGMILIDEATRTTYRQWLYFKGRLSQRYGNAISPSGARYRSDILRTFLITMHNPGGRGYLWQIYKRDHPLAAVNQDPDYLRVEFHTKTLQEKVNPSFWKSLQDIPEHMKSKLLGSDEDPFAGLVFPHFNRALHVFNQQNFIPPRNWIVSMGADYGRQTPTTFTWAALTEEGCMVIFREFRKRMSNIRDIVESVNQTNTGLFNQGMGQIKGAYIDATTNIDDGKNPSGQTVFQQFIAEGLWYLQLASKVPITTRVERLSLLLHPDKKIQNHPISGEFREEGWPRLIFTSDCPETIEEFETWEYPENRSDKKDPNNKPEEKDDHGIDSTFYGIHRFLNAQAPEHESTRQYKRLTENLDHREKVEADLARCLKGDEKGTKFKPNGAGSVF